MWRGAPSCIVFAQKFAVSQASRGIESARGRGMATAEVAPFAKRRGNGGHDGSNRETDDLLLSLVRCHGRAARRRNRRRARGYGDAWRPGDAARTAKSSFERVWRPRALPSRRTRQSRRLESAVYGRIVSGIFQSECGRLLAGTKRSRRRDFSDAAGGATSTGAATGSAGAGPFADAGIFVARGGGRRRARVCHCVEGRTVTRALLVCQQESVLSYVKPDGAGAEVELSTIDRGATRRANSRDVLQ
jgi:hypothetical protein